MNTLRLFSDVAQLHSFSEAAKKHGVTQSAASQRVSALEKRLGVTLLDRSVRPLALTEAGEVYLRGCVDQLDRYEKLERRIARYKAPLEGRIRVEAIYSAGMELLANVKERFAGEHPNLEVMLEYRQPNLVYEEVRGGRCDLGIVSYPNRWRDVEHIVLRDEQMVVVCSPRHPLAKTSQVEASSLGLWTMINFESSLPVGRKIKRYLRDHGASPVITNVFDNMDTIKSAVAVTDDIAILPRLLVEREVAGGTLVAVELLPELSRPMGLIYKRPGGRRNGNGSGNGLSEAVGAFVDFLVKDAGGKSADGDIAEGSIKELDVVDADVDDALAGME